MKGVRRERGGQKFLLWQWLTIDDDRHQGFITVKKHKFGLLKFVIKNLI